MSQGYEIGDVRFVFRTYGVREDKAIIACMGCGLPVDTDNPRSYGRYGACCAPPDPERVREEVARRQAMKRLIEIDLLVERAAQMREAAALLDVEAQTLREGG